MDTETNTIIALFALVIAFVALVGVGAMFSNQPNEVSLVSVKSDIQNLKNADTSFANVLTTALNKVKTTDTSDIEYNIEKLFDDVEDLEEDFDDLEIDFTDLTKDEFKCINKNTYADYKICVENNL